MIISEFDGLAEVDMDNLNYADDIESFVDSSFQASDSVSGTSTATSMTTTTSASTTTTTRTTTTTTITTTTTTRTFMALSTTTASFSSSTLVESERPFSPFWGQWSSWLQCSESCGGYGEQTRLRECVGTNLPADCGEGSTIDWQVCNIGNCPEWTSWSSWECSKYCRQNRTRTCEGQTKTLSCQGPSTEESECASCGREMILWNNKYLKAQRSDFVHVNLTEFCFALNDDDTTERKCGTYCHSLDHCLGMEVRRTKEYGREIEKCYVYLGPFTGKWECYGSTCYEDEAKNTRSNIFGVFQDVFDQYSMFLPTEEPDGKFSTDFNEMCGHCSEITTSTRDIKYLKTHNLRYTTQFQRNVIYEWDLENCTEKCIFKAGCIAFFIENDLCHHIMDSIDGYSKISTSISTLPVSSTATSTTAFSTLSSSSLVPSFYPDGAETSYITQSGILSDHCQPSVGDTIIRDSQFYCLFRYPNTLSEDQRERILRENNFEIGFPLETWVFENSKINPSVFTSQYVFFDFEGDDEGENVSSENAEQRYRPGRFKIQTYTRDFGNALRRRRQSSERNISAILEELEEIEAKAVGWILGYLNLPEGIEVRATSPVQVLSIRQITNDGSISADCSSGKCVCNENYIDNGAGCVEKTEEISPEITTEKILTIANQTKSNISVDETTPTVLTSNALKNTSKTTSTSTTVFTSKTLKPTVGTITTEAATTTSSESPNIERNSCKTFVQFSFLGFILLNLFI